VSFKWRILSVTPGPDGLNDVVVEFLDPAGGARSGWVNVTIRVPPDASVEYIKSDLKSAIEGKIVAADVLGVIFTL